MKQLLHKTNLELKLALGLSAIFFCAWVSLPINAAQSSEEARQELAAVGDAIGEIQSWLIEAKSTQSIEIRNLQQADLQISTFSQSIIATQVALNETESEIESLSREADQLSIEKSTQSKILEQAIRTAYM